MRNAFYAGTIAAVTASLVGYFVIIRNLSFAGHALSHIGFAGATGAGLIGLNPITGQLLLTLLAAMGMGTLGKRINKSDKTIGIILAFSLGLGMLFLHFYNTYAGQVTAILFGDLLGVSNQLLKSMLIYSALSLILLAFITRPLLFASLEPELAEAKGVSLTKISVLFLLIVAVAVTQATQAVGILLVFTLLIGPAAAATNCTRTITMGITVTLIFAISIVWIGIILAYFTDLPTSFWISALSLVVYLASIGIVKIKNR
jgi:zinc/manganese transport system permease protein